MTSSFLGGFAKLTMPSCGSWSQRRDKGAIYALRNMLRAASQNKTKEITNALRYAKQLQGLAVAFSLTG